MVSNLLPVYPHVLFPFPVMTLNVFYTYRYVAHTYLEGKKNRNRQTNKRVVGEIYKEKINGQISMILTEKQKMG